MPRCQLCRELVKASDLYELEDGRVACLRCATEEEEDPMAKKDGKKRIASLEIYEIDLEDGEKDYQIEVGAAHGALNLTFAATVDEIRRFFTERRDRKGKKEADVVPITSSK
jgi:hypothetical protein